MRHSSANNQRVLAVEPCAKGFGFAVLEGPEALIDWGLKEIRGQKNPECLRQIAILFERYYPDVIVIGDYQYKNCRRCVRIKVLLEDIATLALSKKVRLRTISRLAVRRAFSQYSTFDKHQIAIEIGGRFPELAAQVPPPRKPWKTQDARISIFDAVAFAFAFSILKKSIRDHAACLSSSL
jgi:hypothetical protein